MTPNNKRWKGCCATVLASVMLLSCCPQSVIRAQAEETTPGNTQTVLYENKDYNLRFNSPAEDSMDGWKNASLPLGNGYMGVNVFGGVDKDRLQITEQSLYTSGTTWDSRYCAGQESFADVYIDTTHTLAGATDYTRTLRLNDGVANVSYTYDGTNYTREYFSSYPDKVTVIKLAADGDGKISFTLRPVIAYERDKLTAAGAANDSGKRGTVVADADTQSITLSGNSAYYNIDFEAQFKIVTDGGSVTASNGTDDSGQTDNGTLTVTGANSAYIYFAVGTNYVLDSKAFTAYKANKLKGNAHPHEKISGWMTTAGTYTYDQLKSRHQEDVKSFFNRNVFDLGGADDERTTAALISSCKNGTREPYLEELYYQMGRYMMIASSREGTLPPGLQATWNAYEVAPWTAGYWYNVNQQMNYWPIFSTNLGDLYKSYSDFNLARLTQAESNGSNYIKAYRNEQYEEGAGKNGWIVGVGNSPYKVDTINKGGHTGPGVGGFTAISDIDYLRYTEDPAVLSAVYPIIESLARFYSKCVDQYGESYLSTISASPEQKKDGSDYQTIGCAFDQQMIYEANKALIDIYDKYKDKLENPDTELIEKIRKQLDHYDPVLVGLSGQVKEYREENYYGEIGEKQHRHISQLVGLYPGTSINDETPAWLDAAKVTLKERGLDTGTGWSVAHKLGMWARCGDGDTCYTLIEGLLKKHLFDNMWNCHDVRTDSNLADCAFQADANFGATAAIGEMLLQSQGEYIKVLPALPSVWSNGSFRGMVARGNFTVNADWTNGIATKIEVTAAKDGTMKLNYRNVQKATITKNNTAVTDATFADKDHVAVSVSAGDKIVITTIPTFSVTANVSNVSAAKSGNNATVSWTASSDANVSYKVYRAIASNPTYELLTTTSDTSYTDSNREGKQATYKVTATASGKEESLGGTSTVIASAEKVTSVSAFMADDTHLQVQWSLPEYAQSFKLYKKSGSTYTLLDTTTDGIFMIKDASASDTYAISSVYYETESDKTDFTAGEQGTLVSKLALYNYIEKIDALYDEAYSSEDMATIADDVASVRSVWSDTSATASDISEAVTLAQSVLTAAEYFSYNVTLNKPVTIPDSVKTNDNCGKELVTDGKLDTRMATYQGATDELVFTVDLQDSFVITKFELVDWRDNNGSRGDAVKVEGLYNGSWITMAEVANVTNYDHPSSKRTIAMNSTVSLPVTQLRVTMTNTDSYKNGMSIWEFTATGAKNKATVSAPAISNLTVNPDKPASNKEYKVVKNVQNGSTFYSDREYIAAHLGSSFKGLTQILLPLEDSNRASNSELKKFMSEDHTYFSFDTNSDGAIYVAFPAEVPTFTAARGWTLVSSSVPKGTDNKNLDNTSIKGYAYDHVFTDLPYYVTKFQYDSGFDASATPSWANRFIYVYKKSFTACETVEVPTMGIDNNENYFVVVDLNGENTNTELDYIVYNGELARAESGKTKYEFEVDESTQSVSLSAIAKNSGATVSLSSSNLSFTNGLATATITVTSGSNTSNYTVTFKKLTNIALNKPVKATPESKPNTGGEKPYGNFSDAAITDGSYAAKDGRYYSGAMSNITAEIYLLDTYTIDHINVSEFRGSNTNLRTDKLSVWAYHNGTWTKVVDAKPLDGAVSSDGNYSTTSFKFSEAVTASRLKLTFNNSGVDNGETNTNGVYNTAGTAVKDISIVEVEAYGMPTSAKADNIICEKDENNTFAVALNNIAKNSTVLLALYNGNELKEVKSKTYTGAGIVFTPDTKAENYTSAKIMVLDSLTTLKPLCEALKIPSES